MWLQMVKSTHALDNKARSNKRVSDMLFEEKYAIYLKIQLHIYLEISPFYIFKIRASKFPTVIPQFLNISHYEDGISTYDE